jgi:hypothetical protein
MSSQAPQLDVGALIAEATKPGHKTTEFWLTFGTTAALTGFQTLVLPHLPSETAQAATGAASLLAQAAMIIGYQIIRARAKQ